MKDSVIGRRAFLRGAAGLATAAAASTLVACGTGTSRSGAGAQKTLLVRNSGGAYGDALQKALYEPFTKETGIAVQPVNVQYAQMMAQIQQGRPQFDVIDNSVFDYVKMARDNALEELDYDRLPHSKNAGIAESLVTPHSLGKSYWGSVLAYRTDAFGGKQPTSWADVWDAQAFPGNRSLQNPDADLPELEFALLADGVALENLYPLDIERAFRALDRVKPAVLKYWDTGNLPGVLLSRQEVVMSTVWHGRLDELIKQGVPLAYEYSGAPAGAGVGDPHGLVQPGRRLPAHRLLAAPRDPSRHGQDLPGCPGGHGGVRPAVRGGGREPAQRPGTPGDRVRHEPRLVARERGRRGQPLAGVGPCLTSDTVTEAEGCCGLAGNFGFEDQHYDTSMAVADLSLQPRLDQLPDAVVVADGFSCATQVDHIAGGRGIRAVYLAELLDPGAGFR